MSEGDDTRDAYTSHLPRGVHESLARDLFNRVWDLIDKPDRSITENDAMVQAAHASRFHWGVAGGPRQWARGEWQLSRVYAILGRLPAARFHARRCKDLVQRHTLGPFDEAFADEAMARVCALSGDSCARDRLLRRARAVAAQVTSTGDREWIEYNLDAVSQLSRLQIPAADA
ncbi:MAG: hypothetical protein ACP5QO_03530 [Clostridia bacterium]